MLESLKIEMVKGGKKPTRGTDGSTGLDCYRNGGYFKVSDSGVLQIVYPIGFKMEIPRGYTGYIVPRSSTGKTLLRLANSMGVLDSDWRGESMAVYDIIPPTFRVKNTSIFELVIKELTEVCGVTERKVPIEELVSNIAGSQEEVDSLNEMIPVKAEQAVCQLIISRDEVDFDITEVESLTETDRGENGFGSTNK